QEYKQDVFHQPKVEAKFFNSKVTFEIPMSFTELQVKESFSSAEQLNGFISMITTSIENSMTVKLDSLIMRAINNMIAETLVNGIGSGAAGAKVLDF
ncbi:phage major capsid protein, partial [Staphylococcus aureus]